jgi:polyisoprenoid-binding protein YceI
MKKILSSVAVVALLAMGNANAETANSEITPAKTAIDIPAGAYTTDKTHSTLVFSLSHLGFSHYTAQFTKFDAKLNLDPAQPQNSTLDVTIDPTSLSLPNPPAGFTEELLGDKWLDAKAFPQITFKSTKIEVLEGNKAIITGDLTLHGITKPITLDTTFNGGWKGLPDMDPHARAGFSARGTFKRSDFGVSSGIPAAGSNMGVGDELTVVIETEFSGPELKGK